MKTTKVGLVLGQAPSRRSRVAFDGAERGVGSGARLLSWLGISAAEFRTLFEVDNVLRSWPGKVAPWEKGDRAPGARDLARAAARVRRAIAGGAKVVVAVGNAAARAVTLATGLAPSVPGWDGSRGVAVYFLPHPSGANLRLSDPTVRARAEEFARDAVARARTA